MIDDDSQPTITEDVRRAAQHAFHSTTDADLWATHVLICSDCESFNLVAYGGAQASIASDGLPISETCHDCETKTRQYDVRGLDRRQSQ